MPYRIGIRKPNRNNKRDRIGKWYYCWSCDCALVNDGMKCPVCGQIANGKSRNKKPGPKE